MFQFARLSLSRALRVWRNINWRGEMVATAGSFGASVFIRLISSLILTRLLFPEAYGVVAMIGIVAYVIELTSDIGIVAFLVKHKKPTEFDVMHTVWTLRLARSLMNAVIMFMLAPIISVWYQTPVLELALQIYASTFIIKGFESISFLLAIRNQESKIVTFAELWATGISAVFTIAYSYFSRDHFGMLFGMILHRLIVTVISYIREDRISPKLCWNNAVIKDIFGFAKYIGPSSILTIFITQFDKVLVLKLFDLRTLGLYGVAGSVSGPVNGLITQISTKILYPRCAEYIRNGQGFSSPLFYRENIKLLLFLLTIPAIVGGLATPIITILFDHRYIDTAVIVQALCIASVLSALTAPSENLLVAHGKAKSILVSNIIRFIWLVVVAFLGYQSYGFTGFIFGIATNSFPMLLYLWHIRNLENLMVFRYEILMIAYSSFIWLASWLAGIVVLTVLLPLTT